MIFRDKVVKVHHKKNPKVVYLKQKKKRPSHWRPILLTLLLMVFGLIYYLFKPITYIVKDGNLEQIITANALIIKDETVINSPEAGYLQLLVSGGERVRVGTPLFILSTDSVEKSNLEGQVAQIEQQIRLLTQESGDNNTTAVLVKSIEEVVNSLKVAMDKGELDEVKTLKEELEFLNEEMKGSKNQKEWNVDTLRRILDSLKSRIAEVDMVVSAPVAGIVSANIDGLENTITIERANVDFDSILSKIKANTNITDDKIIMTSKVKAGHPVLKIMDNFSWYVVMDIPKDLQKSRYYNISIGNIDERIRTKLIQIDEKNGRGVFFIDMDLEGLIDDRVANVSIFVKKYAGKIIPVDSITDDHGDMGVFVATSKGKQFKDIEILYDDGEMAIVEGLKIGDKLIIDRRGFE